MILRRRWTVDVLLENQDVLEKHVTESADFKLYQEG